MMNRKFSDDDDDEFILADTGEDSDGSVDLELGQADYWKCVKCNNTQNNPRFRYCERCYQVSQSSLAVLFLTPSINEFRKAKHVETCSSFVLFLCDVTSNNVEFIFTLVPLL